jgi:hypothetical protein
MLLRSFLARFKEYNKSILQSNQKNILMLILMIINRVESIKQSNLSEKYLRSIYRFFETIDQNTFSQISSAFNKLSDEMFFKWANLSATWRRKNPLVISIDDSVIEKFGKKMNYTRILKDSNGRYIKGYSLLAITLSIGCSPAIPIAVFWHKKEDKRSKIKLSADLIKQWIETKLDNHCFNKSELVVCFDNWYLCGELSQFIDNLGVCWVSKLKSNWNISAEVSQNSFPVTQLNLWTNYWIIPTMKVKSFFKYALKPQKVFRFWHRSLDVCYATQSQAQNGKIWLASNHCLKHKTMCKLYRLRWKIEVFFKDLKQSLKVSSCHFVEFSKNKFFMELRILVLSILQLIRINNRQYSRFTVGDLMGQLQVDLKKLTKNHHNPLIYLQLHLFNKSQNPFNALCTKALNG